MKKAHTGFTLIELMITVAIVGILAAIAYPTYLDKVRASRRTDAKTALLKAANREEQYYTTQHEYTDDLDKLGVDSVTDNKAYTLSASVSGTDNQKFTITATAQNDQANDKCTPLSINQTGQKKVNGSTADIGCW